MRLSRTFVGSDDLSVSPAEAALDRDQFPIWPSLLAWGPRDTLRHPCDDACMVDHRRQGVGTGTADSAILDKISTLASRTPKVPLPLRTAGKFLYRFQPRLLHRVPPPGTQAGRDTNNTQHDHFTPGVLEAPSW